MLTIVLFHVKHKCNFVFLFLIHSYVDLLDHLDPKEFLAIQESEVNVDWMAEKEIPVREDLRETLDRWAFQDQWVTFQKVSSQTLTDDEAVTPTKRKENRLAKDGIRSKNVHIRNIRETQKKHDNFIKTCR